MKVQLKKEKLKQLVLLSIVQFKKYYLNHACDLKK